MIKLVDLSCQHNPLKSQLETTFSSILEQGQFILGKQVKELETTFAAYQNCKYGIGVSNGTDALVLTLKALGIGEGDEVIVPSMTFFATAEAVCLVGARPVIVDVEPKTFGLYSALVEDAITAKTKAIIPVHLHGWAVPLSPLLDLAERFDLFIIEDCAQAHGAKENNASVGSRSAAGCFSFFPGKNLGALGDGGMVVTNNLDLADKIRSLANHGRRDKYLHNEVGYNARLDELQAALLNIKLPHLETWNEQRRILAKRYREKLMNLPLHLPPDFSSDRLPVFHLYVIQCESEGTRDRLAVSLKEQGIQTGIHYPVPLHLQPAFAYLGYQQGDFPVSEHAAKTMLSIPIYPGMTEQQQDFVIENITKFILE